MYAEIFGLDIVSWKDEDKDKDEDEDEEQEDQVINQKDESHSNTFKAVPKFSLP